MQSILSSWLRLLRLVKEKKNKQTSEYRKGKMLVHSMNMVSFPLTNYRQGIPG